MVWTRWIGALWIACAASVAAGAVQTAPAPVATAVPNPLAARFREALKGAERQVGSTPEWMRIHAGFVVQDWASMLADARTLAGRFPASADPQVAIAVALAGAGDRAGAVTALSRAVELAPAHLHALAMLAQLQLAGGQWSDAARTFEQALAVKPDDLAVLLALGDAQVRGGEAARAAAAYQRATALAPDSVPAWLGYLDAASRAGAPQPAQAAFNQLRIARPGAAAAVLAQARGAVLAVVPTPIPPTPRPTPRTDTPHLVMASGPGGGAAAGQRPTIWNEAALGFEAKVADIAARARPLAEMVERYDLTCQGGASRRSGAAAAGSEEKAPPVEVDWKAIWARREAWITAAQNAPTSECRTLASDIVALADATRAAVDQVVQSTAGSGLTAADRAPILQKYNLQM